MHKYMHEVQKKRQRQQSKGGSKLIHWYLPVRAAKVTRARGKNKRGGKNEESVLQASLKATGAVVERVWDECFLSLLLLLDRQVFIFITREASGPLHWRKWRTKMAGDAVLVLFSSHDHHLEMTKNAKERTMMNATINSRPAPSEHALCSKNKLI